MSKSILLLGESGSGKSTSIRNLPPEHTFIINVIAKPLPFKGAKNKYSKLSADGTEGNYYASDDTAAIARVINLVNNKRADIHYLIIDDFGYTISNSFMRKANQKGYEKYTELAVDTFHIIDRIMLLRDDLYCVVMMHTDIDTNGRYKPRTAGKMIDQYINIEGRFSYVFHSMIVDRTYCFLTNNDSTHMAKTPMGMFEEQFIDNDLFEIINRMEQYADE